MTPTASTGQQTARSGNYVSLFLCVFLLVVITTTLITFILPETFKSTARIKLEWGRENAMPLADPRLVETEVAVIQSEMILTNVVWSLDLMNHWGRRYNNGDPLRTSEVVRILKSVMEARAVEGQNIIDVSFYDQNPIEAQRLADAAAMSYVRQSNAATNGLKAIIIDGAKTGLKPVRPNKPLNIALGIIAGAFAGGLVVVLLRLASTNRSIAA